MPYRYYYYGKHSKGRSNTIKSKAKAKKYAKERRREGFRAVVRKVKRNG